MYLALKYHIPLLCILLNLYREVQSKDFKDEEVHEAKQKQINNGTLIRLAKYLSGKVTTGKFVL